MPEGLFNGSFTIWRAASTSAGDGRFAATFAQVGTADGRLAAPSARDLEIAGKNRGRVTHVFATAQANDIRPGDQVRGGVQTVLVLAGRPSSSRDRSQYLCEADRDAGGDV